MLSEGGRLILVHVKTAVSLKEDGCVYDFVYVAPVDDFDDGRLAFQIFVESLTLDSERSR